MKPLIILGTPCYGGLVAQAYMESVIHLMNYALRNDFDVRLMMLGGDSLITRSRNTIVANFLDTPEATHLMFIDADISFQPEDVHRMLKFDHEVVAGMYPIKNIDWNQLRDRARPDMPLDKLAEAGLRFVGMPCAEKDREHRGEFITGIYAGTGFMLMRRSCIERMTVAYANTKYNLAHTYPVPKQRSQNQYALFDCMIEPGTNIYLSEDFAFCRRWRDIGGKIWLDPKSRLTHHGSFRFQGSPEDNMAAAAAVQKEA